MENKNTSWKNLSRVERGKLISQTSQIIKIPGGWRVPSQSDARLAYLVKFRKHKPECECPDCQIGRKKCKHIYAVEFYIKQEIDQEGKIKQTKGIKISYSQKWKAYDKSQTSEKLVFMRLLNDLCGNVGQPEYKFGRPKMPMQDLVFSSVMKIYTTFSLRRFMSDVEIASERGYILHKPCFASVGHFLQKKELTPILKDLIQLSALPLKAIETQFALDSSGFSTSRFARYYNYKYGKESKYRIWLKAHLLSGVKTNIVANVEITEGRANDSPQLAPLVKGVRNFDVKEISCDRAYSSKKNLQLIYDEGALPLIPFKKNTTGRKKGCAIWRKMYYMFLYKHDEFLEKYHKRSNAETVFHMLKTKFKDNLRSKSKTAQINELLCKILANNICVVIQEMNELGVKGEFVIEKNNN